MALLSETERETAYEITQQIEHVALAARQDFADILVDSMNFSGQPFPTPTRTKPRRGTAKRAIN